MATNGSIQEFLPEVETIDSYLEGVKVFTLANGIKEEKRVGFTQRDWRESVRIIEKFSCTRYGQ